MCFIVLSYHGLLPTLWELSKLLEAGIYRCSIESEGMIYISLKEINFNLLDIWHEFSPTFTGTCYQLPATSSGGSNHLLSTRHRGAAPFYRKMTGERNLGSKAGLSSHQGNPIESPSMGIHCKPVIWPGTQSTFWKLLLKLRKFLRNKGKDFYLVDPENFQVFVNLFRSPIS